MNIAVVTGTSTGIGFATSLHLARHGYRVFAGMRNLAKADPLEKAAAEAKLPLEVIALDVNSGASIDQAFQVVAAAGPVDVLVNNAGIGAASPLELTPEAEHRAIFETNYFGAIRCIQAVLPSMRERQSGTIVNVTSVTGLIAMPNQIAYSASKWALECAGEALAHEVRRFGVRVVNVEPGVVQTSIFENSAPATRYDKASPYQPIMRRNGKFYAAGFRDPVPAGGRGPVHPRSDHNVRLSAAVARGQGRDRDLGGPAEDGRRGLGRDGRRSLRRRVQPPRSGVLRHRPPLDHRRGLDGPLRASPKTRLRRRSRRSTIEGGLDGPLRASPKTRLRRRSRRSKRRGSGSFACTLLV